MYLHAKLRHYWSRLYSKWEFKLSKYLFIKITLKEAVVVHFGEIAYLNMDINSIPCNI